MEYKLTYFNFRGRAEASRLVFVLAGVPFEDVRIKCEDWADHKPHVKFHQLPTLETGGKIYTQSHAIMCYLGRKFGFYPTDIEKAFKVDEVIHIMEDYIMEAIKEFHAPEDQMVTVADLIVFAFVSDYEEGFKDFPKLKAFMGRIGNLDRIKDWLNTRPKSDY